MKIELIQHKLLESLNFLNLLYAIDDGAEIQLKVFSNTTCNLTRLINREVGMDMKEEIDDEWKTYHKLLENYEDVSDDAITNKYFSSQHKSQLLQQLKECICEICNEHIEEHGILR